VDLTLRTEDPRTPEVRMLRLASAGYLVTAAAGTWVSWRDDLPGEPLGLRTPLGVQRDLLVGFGAALSPPWPLLVGLVWGVGRSRRPGDRTGVAVVTGLAAASLAGTAAEPVTSQVLGDPGTHPRRTALATAYLALSTVLLVAGLRILARSRSPDVRAATRQRSIPAATVASLASSIRTQLPVPRDTS
jgi:hypothetical protein